MRKIIAVDFEVMKRQFGLLGAIALAVCVIFPFVVDASYSIASFACLVVGYSYLLSLFALDEQSGWGAFEMAMPITRGCAVGGRYVEILMVACAMSAAFGISRLICMIGLGGSAEEELWLTVALVIASIAPLVILAALIFPFLFRFGITKATRGLAIVVLVSIFIVIPVVSNLSYVDISSMLEDIAPWALELMNSSLGLIAASALLLGIALVVYLASMTLSVKLFAGKDL